MRFVPIKSDDQLDLQSLHRVRECWVMRRTAVINQIRGLLLERGVTLRQGRGHVDAALPGILIFLPGLLANYAMTQPSNPALSNPVTRKSLPRLPN
jgi:transposase